MVNHVPPFWMIIIIYNYGVNIDSVSILVSLQGPHIYIIYPKMLHVRTDVLHSSCEVVCFIHCV